MEMEPANLPAKEGMGLPRSQGEGVLCQVLYGGALPQKPAPPFVYHFDSTPFVYISLKKVTFAYFHNVPVL